MLQPTSTGAFRARKGMSMRTKLYLAAIGAALAIVGTSAVPATAQTQAYYGICPSGQIPDPDNPYYCIPEPKPAKKKPKLSLKVKPKFDKTKPFVFRASGKLRSLKGVSKKRGCRGTVKVTFRKKNKVVARKKAKLRSTCKYRAKVKVRAKKLKGRRGKIRVRARFLGNSRLKPATSKIFTVKYKK
jgi:hypothetical protein